MATTQTRERTKAETAPAATKSQAVAVIGPPRLPYNPEIQKEFQVSPTGWRALTDSVFPSAKTVDGIFLALAYCKERKLDVMKKMVHVVPVWNSALQREVESVWPGIAEHRATAFRTGLYAGCDATIFGEDVTTKFEGKVKKDGAWETVKKSVTHPAWAQVTVYRLVGGIRCAFPGPRIHYLAAYGKMGRADVPNEKWERGGGGYMLEKCAEAAALRKAFPEELGDEAVAEEMEDRDIATGGYTIDHEPDAPVPERPTRQQADQVQEEHDRQDEHVRDTAREPARQSRQEAPPADDPPPVDQEPEGRSSQAAPAKETKKAEPAKKTTPPPNWENEARDLRGGLIKTGSDYEQFKTWIDRTHDRRTALAEGDKHWHDLLQKDVDSKSEFFRNKK